jgi:hypothetical protein
LEEEVAMNLEVPAVVDVMGRDWMVEEAVSMLFAVRYVPKYSIYITS